MDIKNEIPKFETVAPYDMLAFTVNPEPQYFGDLERLQKVIYYMKKLLASPNYEYKLYIEISPKGRIHGHGWITIVDPIKFYLFDIEKLIKHSTICIKPIDNDEKWTDYCTKQAHITRRWISRLLPRVSDNLIKTTLEQYYDNLIVYDNE